MSYLEKKRNLYYAVLKIPKELLEHFGKTKFSKSSRESDKRKAKHISMGFVSDWKRQIEIARKLAFDSGTMFALNLRRDLDTASETNGDTNVLSEVVIGLIDQLREENNSNRDEKVETIALGNGVILAFRTQSSSMHRR